MRSDADFVFLDEIGSGTFASVYKCFSAQMERTVALKKIFWNSSPERTANEMAALISLRGAPNVVQIIGGYRESDIVTLVTTYHQHQSFKSILFDMNADNIRQYMKSLLIAVRSTHEANIIHRDVKPGNFLFDIQTGEGHLCDYGLCERLETMPEREDIRKENLDFTTLNWELNNPDKIMNRPAMEAPRAGTRGYRAPEVLWKYPNQTTAIDIWSSGMCFLNLLTRRYPFFVASDDISALAEMACIIDESKLKSAALECGRMIKLPHLSPAPSFEDLVTGLNPSFASMKVSPTAFDLLEHMLDPNPFTRYTAEQCLSHPYFSTI